MSKPARVFRKKPIEVLAWQFIEHPKEGPQWITMAFHSGKLKFHPDSADELRVDTLEGVMIAGLGDWIIEGIHGELYPCKASIFAETYEEVGVTQ